MNDEFTALFLHKRAYHNNATIQISLDPVWELGLVHVDDVFITDYDHDDGNVLVPNMSQPDCVHVHDANNTDSDNGGALVTNVSPQGRVHVDDVLNTEYTEYANDNSNALVPTVSPQALGKVMIRLIPIMITVKTTLLYPMCVHWMTFQPWMVKSSNIFQISCAN